MGQSEHEKKKLHNRIRRIEGQLQAVNKALDDEENPVAALQTLAAARGALNGLMAEVLEAYMRVHLLDGEGDGDNEQSDATDELLDIVRAYMK